MTYTFEQLKAKTLSDLRDIAQALDADAVKGWSQMNKEHLLPVIARALNVDTHVHTHVEGVDKASLKAQLHALKAQRDAAIAAGDHARLHALRRERHHLNRRIRSHTVIES